MDVICPAAAMHIVSRISQMTVDLVLRDSTPLSSARDERSPGARRRPQPTDPSRESRERLARDRHLRQVERHHLGVMRHLRADLDRLLAQRRQRPHLHRLGQRPLPEEGGQVVGQGERLQPRLVVLEPAPALVRLPISGGERTSMGMDPHYRLSGSVYRLSGE